MTVIATRIQAKSLKNLKRFQALPEAAAAKGAIELHAHPLGCIELHVAMEQNRSAPEIDRYATDRLAAIPMTRCRSGKNSGAMSISKPQCIR
jgi:hypothetical protein